MRSTTIALAFAIVLSSAERAAHSDPPSLDAGIRLGFVAKTHDDGPVHFVGNGFDLGVEAGVRIVPAFTLRVGLERGPQFVHRTPYQGDTEITRRDIAIVGVAELHRDPFFVGAGGGWVQESSTQGYQAYDVMGPTGIASSSSTRSGKLALARGGIRLGTAYRLSLNLVMQLTGQWSEGPASVNGPYVYEHAYGASLGVELRGLAPKKPPVAPHD